MQEKSGAWPNGQTPLCLQSEQTVKVCFHKWSFFLHELF